jgi:hypothetical protein
MDASLENQPPEPDAILNLIKNAIERCRESSSKLCGFARGLEIGISTLQSTESTAYDSIERLQERSLRLSASRDEYQLGVTLGINLASDVLLLFFTQVQSLVYERSFQAPD